MFGDPKKLETEQLRGILDWSEEHIQSYLINLYGHKMVFIRKFQSVCRQELKRREAAMN